MKADLFAPSNATISECGRYRYDLHRKWDDGPVALWIMLNPSTADAWLDDPTIRRCRSFSQREGCGALVVANLFAWRATVPKELTTATDPAGPENDLYLRAFLDPYLSPITIAIAAWGAHPLAERASSGVFDLAERLGRELVCLGTTKSGAPRHPLYVRADAALVPLPASTVKVEQ